MTNVIELEDHRKVWKAIRIVCSSCNTQWMGVVHMDSEHFQCPKCFNMTGRVLEEIEDD